MKKICTLLFVCFFTLTSFAEERNYNINITVKGMENQMGILAYYYGDKRFVKDTLLFDAKGVSTIKGKKDIPDGVYLLAFPKLKYTSFDIIMKETEFSITTDTINLIKNATIKNSVENKQMFDDMKFMMPLGVENDSLQKKIKLLEKSNPQYKIINSEIEGITKKITSHRKELIKKYPNTFYSKLLNAMQDLDIPDGPRNTNGSLKDTFYIFHYTQIHYFDNIDFSDSGFIRSPIFQGKLLKYFEAYTYPQPDSIIKSIDFVISKSRANKEMFQFCLNELFLKYAKSEIMGHDAIYVYIAEKYYLSGDAWWATEKSLTELRDRVTSVKTTLIGKIAPNFIVQDSLGKMQVFHDFIAKNKYTVLVFWNSDCGHCQHEIPLLKNKYIDSLKTLGVGVFAVSTEQTDSTFRAFAAKNCAEDWLVCADMRGMSAFRKEYDVIATPKVFIITQDYKIAAKSIPVETLVDFIKFLESMTVKTNVKKE